MRSLPACLAAAVLGCASAAKEPPAPEAAAAPKPGLYAVLATARGEVEVRLFKDDAPLTVAAFLAQAKSGAYDGAAFSRAVPGFLVQAAACSGGAPLPLEAAQGRGFEKAGRMAAPRTGAGSASGEFFITLRPAPWLDGRHAVMGEVTKGLELLAAAAREPRRELGDDGALVDAPLAPLRLSGVRFEERP
jgi:cyclophilin family peptidyl-prolyl cis-trans isomerase